MTSTQSPDVAAADKPWFERWPWLLALFPVIYAGSRVVVVSRGNTETMRALVQNLDITALVLATVLPVGATIALWSFIAWSANFVVRKRRDGTHTPQGAFGSLILPAITVVTLTLTAMPAGYLIGNASVIGLFALCGVFARTGKQGRQRIRRQGIAGVAIGVVGLLGLVLATVLLVIGFGQSTWLPRERVNVLVTGPQTGYVVSTDVRWTRLLDDSGEVHIIASPLVLGRTPVHPHIGWNDRPLLDANSNPFAVAAWIAGVLFLMSLTTIVGAAVRETFAKATDLRQQAAGPSTE